MFICRHGNGRVVRLGDGDEPAIRMSDEEDVWTRRGLRGRRWRTGELWLCQLVVSTQLFWSPIVTEMYCMIADWGGVEGGGVIMHFMSTPIITFLDFFAHTTHDLF